MQEKIESFFKPSSTLDSAKPTCNFDDLLDDTSANKQPEIRIKYTRNAIDSKQSTGEDGLIGEKDFGEQRWKRQKSEVVAKKEKVINKKRSYAQFHLELGQSDFLLHTCKICGVKYAKGDEMDEKVHSTFHKNFTLGIPFKGWRHERVIHLPSLEKDRIILVLNCDPPAQRKKVQEVLQMMEIELGDGWISHELCKVYLFISSQRVAGCVVVEPINTAYKILPDSTDKISNAARVKEAKSKPTTIQFGGICFQREVSRKGRALERQETLDSNTLGSIICEEEAVPASCGVRAIWVSPSNRRRHIATHLLNAVRKSFCTDHIVELEPSQLAFSSPTSSGKALVSKYTGTKSFLVYRS